MIQWGLAALVVLVIGVVWRAAQGYFASMPPLVDDRPGPDLPEDADLIGDDIRGARLAVVTRGYSMKQVDDLLDRIAEQLDECATLDGDLGVHGVRRGQGGGSSWGRAIRSTAALGWPESVFVLPSANEANEANEANGAGDSNEDDKASRASDASGASATDKTDLSSPTALASPSM